MTLANMDILIDKVDKVLIFLESNNPQKESIEWYAINNLHTFKQRILSAKRYTELDIAEQALSRFCIDSVDWNSSLMNMIEDITSEAHRHVINDRLKG